MVDENKNEEIRIPERKVSAGEQQISFQRSEAALERKENLIDEKAISEELKREIELMDMDDSLKAEAKKKAEKIEFLDEKEKLEHLLELARTKGVVFAIQVAKKMGDPYILDILHDILAKEGFYHQFTKKSDDDDK